MLCPNEDCGHSGFSPTGICPKCGDKMIPNEMQHLLRQQKTSASKKVRHYIFQIIYRSIESVLFCGLAYLLMKFLILTYNGLSHEMPDWTPVDESASYMGWVKAALFTLVTFLTFRYRFRSLWSQS